MDGTLHSPAAPARLPLLKATRLAIAIVAFLSAAGLAASVLVSRQAHAATRPFTVVIDPGHGGGDHGAVFQHGRSVVREKEVTLAIARIVARELKSRRIKAVLTRTNDKDMDLPARTALANEMKADVFISLHMNSASEGAHLAEGIETFVLNAATTESAQRLAALENKSVSALEGSMADRLPDTDVALIVKDLLLGANHTDSTQLACAIQNNLVTATSTSKEKHRDRGVKQALFYVLLGADMPSALVEMGFLSHPKDRANVLSAAGRSQVGAAIARAIGEYRQLSGTSHATARLSRCQVH